MEYLVHFFVYSQHHKLYRLKQHKFIEHKFSVLQGRVQSQNADKAMLSLSLLDSGDRWQSLAFLGLVVHHSNPFLCHHIAFFSLCVCLLFS